MILYMAKFETMPELTKIGISTRLVGRIDDLQREFGKVLNVELYSGDAFQCVEKLLHFKFRNQNHLIKGSGGTEFFKGDLDQAIINSVMNFCGMQKLDNLESAKILAQVQSRAKATASLNGYQRIMRENDMLIKENESLRFKYNSIKDSRDLLKASLKQVACGAGC